MTEEKESRFGTWAILELMGHVKMAGYVTEEELFGDTIGRIDIPANEETGEESFTQYFGASSIYRLTPTTEQIARAFAREWRPVPVQPWRLQLPEPN
jgi:hypothetical protein